MSEPDTKRPKLDADAFELVYWPGLPGRGEVVRLLFEEAGVPFNDLANDPKIAVETVVGLIGKDNKGDASNPPVLAPPILRHGKLTINQLPNILLYLAPKIGLAPSPSEGDAIFHLNQITLTILDGLLNEVHDTHHPISTGMYYADQKEEAKKRSDGYTKERIPKFFAYLQRLLDAKTSGDGPWLYGGKLTYVDLVLFQVSFNGPLHPLM